MWVRSAFCLSGIPASLVPVPRKLALIQNGSLAPITVWYTTTDTEISISTIVYLCHLPTSNRRVSDFSKAGVVRCLREYFEAQSGDRAVALQHLVEELASALQWVLLLAEGGV